MTSKTNSILITLNPLYFNTSNPYNFPAVNKNVIGMMKDELSGTIMSGFVGLISKV